jgi:predicted GH43/DUF377 family glycosyl hydrolase
MNTILLCRHPVTLVPESARVIIRPFIPADHVRITTIIGRVLALTEEEAVAQLTSVRAEFDARHYDIEPLLMAHFEKIHHLVFTQRPLTHERKMLLGSVFSGEYSLESAAIFNPSMVPHPDQTNAPAGGLRFIMSLRATGEGHISSIEFRAGTIEQDGEITIDPVSRFVTAPHVEKNPTYYKRRFSIKLSEIGFDDDHVAAVLSTLGDSFTHSELKKSVALVRSSQQPASRDMKRTLESIQWLADSNYELRFCDKLAISERIIFPVSPNESNGIEDARFVRFIDDDGVVSYFATYTAYNGRTILPQFIETKDFLHFRMITLNGSGVVNKGMALFPRRINGQYVMLSRQDDENISIMFSDSPYQWADPQVILRPAQPWETVKLGNCGSPIETEAGWLVITHGVGPMRKYCISAALLDLHDPTIVIGRLAEPLLSPEGNEREGYVPNVVYSCGSLLHNGRLILPYAISDRASAIASMELSDLLEALLKSCEKP